MDGGRSRRRRLGVVVVGSGLALLAAVGCSGDGEETAGTTGPDAEPTVTTGRSSTGRTDAPAAPEPADGAPGTDAADAAEGNPQPSPSVDQGGVAVVDPTVAEADDPEAALVPPSTLLIGDPQPDPDDPEELPPLPPQPTVNACSRLEPFSTADVVGTAAGTPATVESAWDEACRFAAGSVVAEVHFVPEAVVESDWFLRDGIEPVGSVGGDAVGLAGFSAPGSAPSGGYTIALVSRREGVIVAVRGAGDDRLIAEQLAVIADEAV